MSRRALWATLPPRPTVAIRWSRSLSGQMRVSPTPSTRCRGTPLSSRMRLRRFPALQRACSCMQAEAGLGHATAIRQAPRGCRDRRPGADRGSPKGMAIQPSRRRYSSANEAPAAHPHDAGGTRGVIALGQRRRFSGFASAQYPGTRRTAARPTARLTSSRRCIYPHPRACRLSVTAHRHEALFGKAAGCLRHAATARATVLRNTARSAVASYLPFLPVLRRCLRAASRLRAELESEHGPTPTDVRTRGGSCQDLDC
jgi:hypothetical protein